MRKLVAIERASYKAVALDCDGTLWKGIVGEDGIDGIEIDRGHDALQRFMILQSDAGMLLCLASKNNEADVNEVFARKSMPLSAEHIVASKVNWAPKPDSLRQLAVELNIGLDSFIFVDDNPLECSQMQARAPEVLTLRLPSDSALLPHFVEHLWAFDRTRITGTDRRRTAMYRESVARERSRTEAGSLETFLAGLQLQVEISDLSAEHLPRAAQLTQRTNQFNLTTLRRSEGELAVFLTEGHLGRVVHVRDRFGDYGLVGLVLAVADGDTLEVDTFLLSCRALGRGVEHTILASLGQLAVDQKLAFVTLACDITPKNAPAQDFFRALTGAEPGSRARRPSSEVAKVVYRPSEPTEPSEPPEPDDRTDGSASVGPIDRRREAEVMIEIAAELATPEQILARIEAGQHHRRDDEGPGEFLAPATETEQRIARIWTEVLLIDRVGAQDSFLDLGGDSLMATRCVSRLRDAFGVDFSLKDFFEDPTVQGLATCVEDAILREFEEP